MCAWLLLNINRFIRELSAQRERERETEFDLDLDTSFLRKLLPSSSLIRKDCRWGLARENSVLLNPPNQLSCGLNGLTPQKKYRARDLVIHGPAHRGANSEVIPTAKDDQDDHFSLTTPEIRGGLLRRLGVRSFC